MRVIAVVEELGEYNGFVRVVPDGVAYELLGPQRPAGHHLVLTLPGLEELSDPAMTRWLAVHHASGEHRVPTELFGDDYQDATLVDFLEAANGERFVAQLPALFGADAFAQLASSQGAEILEMIRATLDDEGAHAALANVPGSPSAPLARGRRLARVLGIERADDVCDELGRTHAVEQLIGLEHAVGRWIAAAARPRADALAALAAALPADSVSAGISTVWYRWWWAFAWAVTRGQLMRAVAVVVDDADAACAARKPPVAAEARAEAARLVGKMRTAERAEAWARPLDPAATPVVVRGAEHDAHACAFAAVSHAAHAIAFGHTVDGLTYAEATRRAMRQLADAALRAVADP